MKKTEYELEDAIMQCFQTSDDLELYLKAHVDGPAEFDLDKQMNVLQGIIEMNKLRCDRAMDVFCEVFQLNEYCTDPEKLAQREYLEKLVNRSKKKGSKK